MDFENATKVAVHDGVFHADDALCVALLETVLGRKCDMIRSRKENELKEADIICDVGHGEFDHHQEDSEMYQNGIKMAACGKVARALCDAGYITKDELEKLKIKALYAVEALDNGQKDTESYPNPFTFVSIMNNVGPDGIYGATQDARFAQVVDMAKIVLEQIFAISREEIENVSLLKDYIYHREDPNYVIMEDKYIRSWQNMIIDYNNQETESGRIMIVMYPMNSKEWRIQVAPKSNSSFDSWVKIPIGVSALDGFVFRHNAAFIAGFTNRESAIEAMKMTIEEGKC